MTSFSTHRFGHIQYISMHCCMTFRDSFHGTGAPWLHRFVPGQQLPASSPQGEVKQGETVLEVVASLPIEFHHSCIIPSLYLEPKNRATSSPCALFFPFLPFRPACEACKSATNLPVSTSFALRLALKLTKSGERVAHTKLLRCVTFLLLPWLGCSLLLARVRLLDYCRI